jgi:hypothetical protein
MDWLSFQLPLQNKKIQSDEIEAKNDEINVHGFFTFILLFKGRKNRIDFIGGFPY